MLLLWLAAGRAGGAEETAALEIHGTGGARHAFQVELARTPEQQTRGLQGRRRLPPRSGMLFLYPEARRVYMWMDDTPLSLDVLFIRADGTIARIVENTTPYSREIMDSGEAVSRVLEIAGGLSGVLGIRPGDRLCYPCGVPTETGAAREDPDRP